MRLWVIPSYGLMMRILVILVALIVGSPPRLLAGMPQWQLETYGGKYYGSDRAGLYGAFSIPVEEDFMFTVEALYEKIDDYQFRGIGGHFLWQLSENTRIGIAGSTSAEYYPFETYVGETLIGSDDARFDLSTAALEAELNPGPFTVAVQIGRIFSTDYDDSSQDYTSIDAYYWGKDAQWYLRGADQRTGDDALTFAEAYRSLPEIALPTTLYAGAATGRYESAYAGAYVQLAADEHSSWTIDIGAGRTDNEWQAQLELYIFLGPGANAPYISAFGFTVGD